MLNIYTVLYNLNLVIKDSVQDVPDASEFFNVVGQNYVYFSNSVKRWELHKQSLNLKQLRKYFNNIREGIDPQRIIKKYIYEIFTFFFLKNGHIFQSKEK